MRSSLSPFRMSRPPAPRPATCPLCEAMCGVLVGVDGGRIRSVRGDPDDPFSRGYVCPKATALPDLHDDPDRIRKPLVRAGPDWREASWEEALDRAAGGSPPSASATAAMPSPSTTAIPSPTTSGS